MVTFVKRIGIKIGQSWADIRGLYQRETKAGSFRAYQTTQVNGRYPSLIGPEEWARRSCRHERIGQFGDFEVALHSDIDVKRRLFSPVIVLQGEFVPEQELRPLFYLRNDALIEPTSGRLLLVISEDYRREDVGGFTHDQNLDQLCDSGLFDHFYPHLGVMFNIFREVAVKERFTGVWGFGGKSSAPGSTRGPSTRVVIPSRDLMGIPTKAESLIERLRATGDQRVTRELAEDIFGVSVEEGKASVKLKKLYRRTAALIHPDRNKNPDNELLCRLLNDAWAFFKDRSTSE
jgi:hypothetical protein